MALTALQILKLLPQTNCGDCGFPTCLAFALKLAAKSAELSDCPEASEEAQQALGAAAAPPIRPCKIGVGDFSVKTGEETVLYRHDKTFYNPTLIAPVIPDDLHETNLRVLIEKYTKMQTERAGSELFLNLLTLKSVSNDPDTFVNVVKIYIESTDKPFILMSRNPELIRKALAISSDRRPLIYCADEDNWEAMAVVAKEFKVPLAVKGNRELEQLADLTTKIKDWGVEDLVIDPGSRNLKEQLTHQTIIRRLALQKNFQPLGYPTITNVSGSKQNSDSSLPVITGICKYSSIILTEQFEDHDLLPLLTLRANIFTDPQKPLQITAGIYQVGEPGPDSPLFVTTNFSLTYFVVSGEIESSDMPAHILLTDAEGMSVLTAWSAGKFTGEF